MLSCRRCGRYVSKEKRKLWFIPVFEFKPSFKKNESYIKAEKLMVKGVSVTTRIYKQKYRRALRDKNWSYKIIEAFSEHERN